MTTTPFQSPDPSYSQRVLASFRQQTVMAAIGASVLSVAPGVVEIELPFRADLCQQDGFLHAGIVTAIVDSACGYAALTLMAVDARVLSVEFKINFLAPAVCFMWPWALVLFLARSLRFRPYSSVTLSMGCFCRA